MLHPRASSRQNLNLIGVRQYASASAWSERLVDTPVVTIAQVATSYTTLISYARSRSVDQWVELLDSYLPLELRSKGWLENLATFEGVRPILTLPTLLIEARASFKLGLLSYVAIEQGRWTALMWLVKELLSCRVMERVTLEEGLKNRQLRYGPDSLDNLTSTTSSFVVKATTRPAMQLPTLDELTDCAVLGGPGLPKEVIRDAVGQIWQAVARIILEVIEHEPEDRKDMMSYVYQIIALMHHYGQIPSTIYNSEAKAPSTDSLQSPMLQLLSPRILAILADAAWKAREQEVIEEATAIGAQYTYKGHEIPGAEHQPRVQALAPQTWLDFVLWSCVQSSMILDAARIISEITIGKRGEKKWKVITWEDLQTSLDYGASTKKSSSGLLRWWLDSIAGTSEGYGQESSMIEMPQRTVSSEVVAAIANAVIDTTRGVEDQSGLSSGAVRDHVQKCKALLARQSSSLKQEFWNAIFLRMLSSDYYPPDSLPHVVTRILDLTKRDHKGSNILHSGIQGDTLDHPIATLGVLHQILFAHSRRGDLNAALSTFGRLQTWVDDNRRNVLTEFWNDFDSMPEMSDHNGACELDGVLYQLPELTLAAFLDLITSTKEYDLGKWLLYSDEVDGPIIPRSSYSSYVLQPALLRFASATSDSTLLRLVTENMTIRSQGFSEDLLRTILHCQIKLRRWTEVADLFTHLTSMRKLPIEALDIMVLAGEVLKLEHMDSFPEIKKLHLRQTQQMLESVLRGAYPTPTAPWQPRDISPVRQFNQSCRVLASVPGSLQRLAQEYIAQSGQSHAPVPIPTSAFNALLDVVVETLGSGRGKALFDLWCRAPRKPAPRTEEPLQGIGDLLTIDVLDKQEKIVTPNLQTIHVILHPVLKSQQYRQVLARLAKSEGAGMTGKKNAVSYTEPKQHNDTSKVTETITIARELQFYRLAIQKEEFEEELLKWGILMYKEMGLSKSEINMMIPGSFPLTTGRHP